jgi:subtilisin family serine protease
MLDSTSREIINSLDNENIIDWGVGFIKAPHVWSKTKGEGVTIVTMDTGVDINHLDLKHKIRSRFNMIEKSLDVADMNGHGSHVAGLLVADTVGVAPMADLHVIKVLNDNGLGTVANVMDGITHSMNIKADVLNISLGIPRDLPLILKQRIRQAYEAGLTIVCAVGNDHNGEARYPAKLDEVIAVGGLDKDGSVAEFSNRDYDVLAPAVDILSIYKDDNYARLTGTSMASPLVAGGIALIKSFYRKQGKELTPSEIKEMLSGRKLDLTEIIK